MGLSELEHKARALGRETRLEGLGRNRNPYRSEDLWYQFLFGWNQADKEERDAGKPSILELYAQAEKKLRAIFGPSSSQVDLLLDIPTNEDIVYLNWILAATEKELRDTYENEIKLLEERDTWD